MKRVLILMSQPPGGTGVQGLRYAKLFPYTVDSGWELHFSGPSPLLTSLLLEPLACPPEHCHYTNNVSHSVQFSILKNRQSRSSPLFFVYGLLQFLTRQIEGLIHHDSYAHLRQGIWGACLAANQRLDFDLLAAKSPDFKILELGAELAKHLGKPFLAIYDDPHGQRDESHFYPDDCERQIRVLRKADAVLFMSPLTRDRYVEQGLVLRGKTFCLTDSYPLNSSFYQQDQPSSHGAEGFGRRTLQMVHLGNLPEWRPIDPLLEALRSLGKSVDLGLLNIAIYGYVYPRAIELVRSDPRLSSCFSICPAVNHFQSHLVAGRADILLVMIGARHLDNQPSKFFVYLGHPRPVLVIGPKNNPIQSLVEQLGIGVYCDVNSVASIRDGIVEIVSNYDFYCQAFSDNAAAISRYRADAVAADLLSVFDQTMRLAAS